MNRLAAIAERIAALPNYKDDYNEVSFKVKGDAVSSLVKLLHHCETCGNQGHTFGIEYDGKNGGFDGDGSDRIADLTVNGKKLPKDFDK